MLLRHVGETFQRKCVQGKMLSKNEAADVNRSERIWKIKSVLDCLASQTKSMTGMGEDRGKVSPSMPCVLL